MTTYSKDYPWEVKYSTVLHLVYRIKDERLEANGLFETREQAEEIAALRNRGGTDWQIKDVMCAKIVGGYRLESAEPIPEDWDPDDGSWTKL